MIDPANLQGLVVHVVLQVDEIPISLLPPVGLGQPVHQLKPVDVWLLQQMLNKIDHALGAMNNRIPIRLIVHPLGPISVFQEGSATLGQKKNGTLVLVDMSLGVIGNLNRVKAVLSDVNQRDHGDKYNTLFVIHIRAMACLPIPIGGCEQVDRYQLVDLFIRQDDGSLLSLPPRLDMFTSCQVSHCMVKFIICRTSIFYSSSLLVQTELLLSNVRYSD